MTQGSKDFDRIGIILAGAGIEQCEIDPQGAASVPKWMAFRNEFADKWLSKLMAESCRS